MEGRGGAAALEDLQADALGLAWLRWIRSGDHTVSARYAVLAALYGGSVCGRGRSRSVDGRGGWKQGFRRTDLRDYDHPASDLIPTLERKIDVHAWMATLPVDLLHVAVVLMHTPAGHQEPCVALGISEETLSALKVRLIASWRAFNR